MTRVATRSPYAAFEVTPPSREAIDLWRTVDLPIHVAAIRGHARAVEIMLARGADVHALTSTGATPLHWSAYADRAEVVEVLIAGGADLEQLDHATGSSAVTWAVLGRGVRALGVLLASGADPDACNRSGETPLLHAVLASKRTAVELLIGHGANPRGRFAGRSLLELALSHGDGAIAALLRR